MESPRRRQRERDTRTTKQNFHTRKRSEKTWGTFKKRSYPQAWGKHNGNTRDHSTERRTGINIHHKHHEHLRRIQKTLHNTATYKHDPLGYVVNLTDKKFTKNDFKLLNKNLNFTPNPGKYNKTTFNKHKNTFYRRVILKSYFGDTEPEPYMGYKKKSNKEWLPKNIHHSVKTFIEAVEHDLEKEQKEKKNDTKQNLTKDEIESLNNLKKREDIIITKADKGGAVVIINVEDYLKEAKRQLDDTEFYRSVNNDLTETHTKIVNKAIKYFAKEKLLPEHVAKALLLDDPKTAKFYLLPKIHKKNVPVPGGPITNAIGCATSTIAELVNFQLQPFVEKLKSYIKDTTDFLNKLEKIGTLPEDAILVTMDVSSLYTNIPHNEGINAAAQTLEEDESFTGSTRVIIKFLSLVLNLNNFSFNDQNYLQIKGCSMGSKCSCTYADLFMGNFETRKIYPLIEGKHLCYYRFRDDIFMIWTGGESALKKFLEDVNKLHDSIKFESKYSRERSDFLDITINITSERTLSTTLYRKPTDRNAYLHYNSYHPLKQKRNIPYGQYLRAKKICSEEEKSKEAMQVIKKKFFNRGYPTDVLEEQIKRTESVSRRDLLEDKEKESGKRIPFIATFNKNLPNIRATMDKHWHLLQTNPKIAATFAEKPIIAFKRNKNLKDLIGQTHLSKNRKIITKPKKIGACSACLSHANNLCCNQIISTKTFQSMKTKEKFNIYHRLNCRSRNVIYLGYCNLCSNSQYVGKSEPPANLRINTHRHDVSSPNGGTFDKHFALPGHNYNKNAKFILIEQVKSPMGSKLVTRKLLENREDYWMSKLQTITPNGFNDHLNSNVSNQIHSFCI